MLMADRSPDCWLLSSTSVSANIPLPRSCSTRTRSHDTLAGKCNREAVFSEEIPTDSEVDNDLHTATTLLPRGNGCDSGDVGDSSAGGDGGASDIGVPATRGDGEGSMAW